MERWIDTSNLPKKTKKKEGKNIEIVDWGKSVGKIVPFKYGDIEGELYINDYKKRRVTISNAEYGEMDIANLQICALGNYLKRFTKDFKFEVGQQFIDEKRDITIIDRKYEIIKKKYYDRRRGKERIINKNEKYYMYHCNKDSYETWILESNLEKGVGCALCAELVTVVGINDIATVRPELVKYFIVPEDARKYSVMSHKHILFKCPICGNEHKMRIADLSKKGFSCPICSDGFSYPEKFVYSCLSQSNVNFVYQLSSSTFSWIKTYRYDFYLPDFKSIIEVHGEQHFVERAGFGGRNDVNEFENDENKKKLAIDNGIEKYFIIDARKSELDWLKQNILSSELSLLIDLSSVDWKQCELDARSSILKKVCNIKKENPEFTSSQISDIVGIERSVVVDYLKKGSKIGLVNYSTKQEMRKSASRNHPRKHVVVKDSNGFILGEYSSLMELEKDSIEKFGFKMHFSETAARCNPNSKKYKKPYHGFIIEEIKDKKKSAK